MEGQTSGDGVLGGVCPFCGQRPESGTTCPDDGLPLVESDVDGRPRVLDPKSPFLGARAAVFASGLTVLVAFARPFVVDPAQDGYAPSAYTLFVETANHLAVVPGAALVAMHTVVTRAGQRALRRVRLGLHGIQAVAFVALGFAVYGVVRYDLARSLDGTLVVRPGDGFYLLVGGLVALAVSTARLGR